MKSLLLLKKHTLLIVLILAGLAPASLSFALVPPLDEGELTEQADVIATGVVLSVKDAGKPYDDACYTWQKQVASFQMQTLHKGELLLKDPITIQYATRIATKKGKDGETCVGGKTSYSLSHKAKYKLYLRKVTRDGQTYYSFINWAGVKKLP